VIEFSKNMAKCNFTCLLFLAYLAILQTSSAQVSRCCPDDTAIRITEKTSNRDDNKKLTVKIVCKDAKGNELRTCEYEEDNKFGPDVTVQSYSYHGSFTYSNKNGSDHNININQHNRNGNGNGIETFD